MMAAVLQTALQAVLQAVSVVPTIVVPLADVRPLVTVIASAATALLLHAHPVVAVTIRRWQWTSRSS